MVFAILFEQLFLQVRTHVGCINGYHSTAAKIQISCIPASGFEVTVLASSSDYSGICLLADEQFTLELPSVHDSIRAAYLSVVELQQPLLTLFIEEPTGQAKITKAYNLPCKYVIHTVGPIIPTGIPNPLQKEQLASCYRSIMQLADENHLESVAFCCISTGEFRFPNQLAAEIAVQTVKDYLTEHPDSSIKQVVFNVFKDIDKVIYQQLL